MSLELGFQLQVGGLKLVGYSTAGLTTSIGVPEAGVLFDVGQGLPWQIPYPTIALSHTHIDHASGVPYLLAQKSMQSQKTPTLVAPSSSVEWLERLIRLWEENDGFRYPREVRTLNSGDRLALKGDYHLGCFQTVHRISSQGYTLFRKRKRLRSEFRQSLPKEIAEARRRGVIVEEHFEENVLSFTGDTMIEFLNSPEPTQSRILVVEATFWDESRNVQSAREWGHIHIDELIERSPLIQAQHIVLIHASVRYTTKDLYRLMEAKIPEAERARFILFPRPL